MGESGDPIDDVPITKAIHMNSIKIMQRKYVQFMCSARCCNARLSLIGFVHNQYTAVVLITCRYYYHVDVI